MKLQINGQPHDFPQLDQDPALTHLISLLSMKADRIAIERNGDIVPRAVWPQVTLVSGDKLEIVQFVGGGI